MNRAWRDELAAPSAGIEPDPQFRERLRDAVTSRSLAGTQSLRAPGSARSRRSVMVFAAAACVALVFGLGWTAGRRSQPASDFAVADTAAAEESIEPRGTIPEVSEPLPTSGCVPGLDSLDSTRSGPSIAAGIGTDGRFFIAVFVDGQVVATTCLAASLADEYFADGDAYVIAAPALDTGDVVYAALGAVDVDLDQIVGGGIDSNPTPVLVARTGFIEQSTPAPAGEFGDLVTTARTGQVAAQRLDT